MNMVDAQWWARCDEQWHLLSSLHLLHVAGADLHRPGKHIPRYHRGGVGESIVREVSKHQVLQKERICALRKRVADLRCKDAVANCSNFI